MDNQLLMGVLIGIIQTIVGHPLDTIKTNMQQNNHYCVMKEKSIISLYRGLRFPLISSMMCNGVLFKSHSYFQHLPCVDNHFVSGFMSGLITTPIVNILDVYKIHCQIKKNNFRICDGYRGMTMTCLRETTATSLYFGLYHVCHDDYKLNAFLSGGIAGVSSWLFTYPLDAIKTRIQSGQCISWMSAIKMGNLTKGLTFCLIRSFIVNSLSFCVYDLDK